MTKYIRPPSEDYDAHWGFASYKGKNILDVGADWGSTAYYFLEHGARKVIAVEGDKGLASQLIQNYGDDPNIVCIEKMVLSPSDFEYLISTYKPDIVKVDIEGHEKHLLGVPLDTIRPIEEWLVETHSDKLFQELNGLFTSLGYKTSVHYEPPAHPAAQIRVIWARRPEIE